MVSVPVLLTEAVIVIAAGIAASDPLVSAIVGGIFLVIGAVINSVTLYLIRKDERNGMERSRKARERATKRNRRHKS